MYRLLVAILLALSVLFGVVIAGSVWLGGYVGAHVLANRIYRFSLSQQVVTRLETGIQLHDLKRRLSTTFRLPVEQEVMDILLESPHHALFITRESPRTEAPLPYELYYMNLSTWEEPHHVMTLSEEARREQFLSVFAFTLRWSPDRRRVAIDPPLQPEVFIYDLETHQTHLAFEGVSANSHLSWSPDSSQLALRTGSNVLLVVNADGTNLRRYEPEIPTAFIPLWSGDSRHILMSDTLPPTVVDIPIRVIDAQTMQPDPAIAAVTGNNPRWCDDRRIVFIRYLENARRAPFVLDTTDGSISDLSNVPLLKNRHLLTLAADESCERLFLGLQPASGSVLTSEVSLYVANLDGSNIRLIHEEVSNWVEHNGEIFYVVPEDYRTMMVYRADLDNLEHRVGITRFQPPKEITKEFTFVWIDGTDSALIYRLVSESVYLSDGDKVRLISPDGGEATEFTEYTVWRGS